MRKAYVCECRVCGDGLVRFWNYREEVVGMCDECELVWADAGALSRDCSTQAAGSFPGGPDGRGGEMDWAPATRRQVERAGLEAFVAGYSE